MPLFILIMWRKDGSLHAVETSAVRDKVKLVAETFCKRRDWQKALQAEKCVVLRGNEGQRANVYERVPL